jgi:hypothetical protein
MSKKRTNSFIAGHIVIIAIALWISWRLDAKLREVMGGSWASSKEWTYLVVFILTAAPLLGIWQVIFDRWWPNSHSGE